jgi:integrase
MDAGTHDVKGPISEMEWAAAFEQWLESRPSPHTRSAYCQAWRNLIESTQKMPWQLTRLDLLRWAQAMDRQGYARKTIALRLGAISSFYRFGLGPACPNPAWRIPLPVKDARRRLGEDQQEAFLACIPTHTLAGARDYALFLAYITTGARNSQVRCLRYKDLLAGGLPLPPGLRRALDRYLQACPQRLKPQDYVFTAWAGGRPSGRPLAAVTVCKLAKKYARLAGLGTWVTVESLRRPHERHS